LFNETDVLQNALADHENEHIDIDDHNANDYKHDRYDDKHHIRNKYYGNQYYGNQYYIDFNKHVHHEDVNRDTQHCNGDNHLATGVDGFLVLFRGHQHGRS